MATQQTFAFLAPPVSPAPPVPPASPIPPAPKLAACVQNHCAVSSPIDSTASSRETVLRHLRVQAGCISTVPDSNDPTNIFTTGSPAIDGLLPRGGLQSSGITEWLSEADGCGAGSLSMIAAATRLRLHPGPLVVVDFGGAFYPPAAVAFGVPADRTILVRPSKHADLVWSIDQALRCESIAAVWANVGSRLDDRDARRFQLAAETGHTAALFVRPVAVRGCPSFADVRFHVRNQTSIQHRTASFVVSIDRCRGGTIGNHVAIVIDDQANIQRAPTIERHETAALHLASELAHPTTAQPNRQRRRHA